MYRQFKIHESGLHMQQIYWRKNNEMPISTYKLTTVTYGTTSASFQVIRTLKQLTEDEKPNFPIASAVLKKELYVDDLLSGSNTTENAINLKRNLTTLLAKGGFDITK